eukprot:SAG22_NODE_1169_length_5270_cov_15.228969_5_plen_216_part_00
MCAVIDDRVVRPKSDIFPWLIADHQLLALTDRPVQADIEPAGSRKQLCVKEELWAAANIYRPAIRWSGWLRRHWRGRWQWRRGRWGRRGRCRGDRNPVQLEQVHFEPVSAHGSICLVAPAASRPNGNKILREIVDGHGQYSGCVTLSLLRGQMLQLLDLPERDHVPDCGLVSRPAAFVRGRGLTVVERSFVEWISNPARLRSAGHVSMPYESKPC